jgi:hypothetical protein
LQLERADPGIVFGINLTGERQSRAIRAAPIRSQFFARDTVADDVII